MILTIVIVLSGCSTFGNNSVDSTVMASNDQTTAPILTTIPVVDTPTLTITTTAEGNLITPIAATRSNTPLAVTPTTDHPTVTQTIEPTVTVPDSSEPLRTCSAPHLRFDVQSVLGVNRFSHLSFSSEETLIFSGWSPRPESEITIGFAPDASTPMPTRTNPPLGGFTSARIIFKAGQLNLATDEIMSHTLSFVPLLADPCDGRCPLEIIGQSPDEQWQFIQISDTGEEYAGMWVVSQEQAVHLINYVPSSSTWQWAVDSSLLWFIHGREEYGADSLIIQLDNPITVTRSETGNENPLDPTYYFMAFSPQDKTVISTDDPFERGLPDMDKLYSFDLAQSFSKAVGTKVIPGITNVVWNEATQSYLLAIIQGNNTDIRTLDGTTLVRIPEYQIPRLDFALSSTGEYLAVGYGAVDGIWVFNCQESSSP